MKYIIKTPEEIIRLHALIYVGLVTEDGINFKPPYIKGTFRYFNTLDDSGSIAPVNQEMIDFCNSDKVGALEAKQIIGNEFYLLQDLIAMGKIINI